MNRVLASFVFIAFGETGFVDECPGAPICCPLKDGCCPYAGVFCPADNPDGVAAGFPVAVGTVVVLPQ